jgi:hypothetical protein
MIVSPPTMATSTGRRQCGQMVRVGSDAPCCAACLIATATRYPLVSGRVAENAEAPRVAGPQGHMAVRARGWSLPVCATRRLRRAGPGAAAGTGTYSGVVDAMSFVVVVVLRQRLGRRQQVGDDV